jgi:hypothetical protein
MDFLDKITEHRFSGLKVGNNAILQGAYGHNVARSATKHAFCFKTNS